jgi:hypothetical protein
VTPQRQWQSDPGARQGRVVHGHHHFHCFHGRASAAERFPVLFKGGQPVIQDPAIGCARTTLGHRGVRAWISIDLGPFIGSALVGPGFRLHHENSRKDVSEDSNNPFAPDQLESPVSGRFAELRGAGERAAHGISETKFRMDIISCHRPNSLADSVSIGTGYFMTFAEHAREAPCRVTSKEPHQIEQMHSEDEHVFAPGATVLLAISAKFNQVAYDSLLQLCFEVKNARRKPHLMGDSDLALPFFGQIE